MRAFAGVIHSFLLLTTPLAALPIDPFPVIPVKKKSHKKSLKIPDVRTLSYDEAMDFLRKVESGSIGEEPSQEDFDKINEFIAFLAMEGSADHEKTKMLSAVDELFYESHFDYAFLEETNTLIQPASATAKAYLYSYYAGLITMHSPMPDNHWVAKKLKAVKKFIKKHKKAIIIGAIVVVTVAVVVVAVVALSAPAVGSAIAAGASALASTSGLERAQNPSVESITSSIKDDITAFKETIAPEQFAATNNSISPEENGRIIGSVFAHKTMDTLTSKYGPSHPKDLNDFGFPPPHSPFQPHFETDLAFSTHYGSTPSWSGSNLNALSYQARGDWALSYGYYAQASQDFSNALAIEPNNSTSYLGRGVANFELGQYDNCVADYNNYLQTSSSKSFPLLEFSLAFAKELPRGVCDSGEGLLLFIADLATHPIQTSRQVYESLEMLSQLAKSGQWSAIGESVSPEVHHLITQWDTLSPRERGELSGYAFGKLGADILIPGATVKIAKSGATAAKELAEICQQLKNARKVFVLEAVAEGGAAGIKVGDLVCYAERTLDAGEDLGLTTKEIGALKEAGELEKVVGNGRDHFAGNQNAIDWTLDDKRVSKNLKPHNKNPLPEAEVRRLIHQQGVPTFPRPEGVPDDFLVRISDKHGGMEYIDPTEKKTTVRVMPGMPYSEHPSQHRPYVVQTKLGNIVDINGKIVKETSPTAHIPLDEFFYTE